MIRAGARTSANTGVSIGPLGLLLLSPFIGVVFMFWFIAMFVKCVVTIVGEIKRNWGPL